jgi:Tfp pilus assembly protein PilV
MDSASSHTITLMTYTASLQNTVLLAMIGPQIWEWLNLSRQGLIRTPPAGFWTGEKLAGTPSGAFSISRNQSVLDKVLVMNWSLCLTLLVVADCG